MDSRLRGNDVKICGRWIWQRSF